MLVRSQPGEQPLWRLPWQHLEEALISRKHSTWSLCYLLVDMSAALQPRCLFSAWLHQMQCSVVKAEAAEDVQAPKRHTYGVLCTVWACMDEGCRPVDL